jgi:Zn-dependent protease with chaperone function
MTETPQSGIQVFADFMDGDSGRVKRVQVSIEQSFGVLRIIGPDAGNITDWPLGDLRVIPDQADRTSIVLGITGDHPARLVIPQSYLSNRLSQICPNLKRRHKDPNVLKRLVILATGAVASVLLIVFLLVPTMADQLALLLPPKGEKAFGDKTFEQIRHALSKNEAFGLRVCEGAVGNAALDKMVARLLPATDFPYELTMHVLDHPMVNAFALPGGHIVLFRGLLQDAKSAEEVAGVLGHEMGHVENRDPTRLALRSAGSVGVLGLLLGDFAGGAAVLFLTEKLIQAQYSRKAEAASDLYSQIILANAGLPSAPMGDFFLRLKGDGPEDKTLLSHLASHPDLQGRADKAVAADSVGSDYQPVLSPSEWQALQQVCAE